MDDEETSERRRRGRASRRAGWVRVALPQALGEKLRRKRLPITGSESMTRTQAVRDGAKLARDVREGRIVFDEKPNASRVAPSGVASD